MYPPEIVHLHPASLQSSHTCALPPRGAKVVMGRKGGKGSKAYVILGFRVPTTYVGAKGEGASWGVREASCRVRGVSCEARHMSY